MASKGGFKVRPLDPGSCLPKMSSEEMVALLQAGKALPKFCRSVRFGPKMADMRGITLDEFSRNLGRGLHFTAAHSDDDTSNNAGGGPSIFTAIQEQAGLKLDPAKGPGEFLIEFLIIDSVSRPSEN
jgi:uncharacterized protein (TIGR03435 family)